VKGACCIHGILTRHRIHYEQGFIWLNGLVDPADLVHHLLIHGQSSGRIDDHIAESLCACMLNGLRSDVHRIGIAQLTEDFHTHLLSKDLELIDGRWSVYIASDQQRTLCFLPFQIGR
jgi:hypothetical protein